MDALIVAGTGDSVTELLMDALSATCEDFMMSLWKRCQKTSAKSNVKLRTCLATSFATLDHWKRSLQNDEARKVLAQQPTARHLLRGAVRDMCTSLSRAGLNTVRAPSIDLGSFIQSVYQRVAAEPCAITGQYFEMSVSGYTARWIIHRQAIRQALLLVCGASVPAVAEISETQANSEDGFKPVNYDDDELQAAEQLQPSDSVSNTGAREQESS